MLTFPNLFATDQVEVITGALTVIGLIVAAIGLFLTVYSIQQASKLASKDRKAALEQAQKDLRWRQTVEAQRAIRRMLDDTQASDAMTMLDWDGQKFSIAERPTRVTHAEIIEALAPGRGEFTEVQAFVRDRIDALLAHLELIQQGIEAEIFTLDDIAFPIDYYIDQMENNIGIEIVKRYIQAFNFPRSERIIVSILNRRNEQAQGQKPQPSPDTGPHTQSSSA
jgi:hypothetical protein